MERKTTILVQQWVPTPTGKRVQSVKGYDGGSHTIDDVLREHRKMFDQGKPDFPFQYTLHVCIPGMPGFFSPAWRYENGFRVLVETPECPVEDL